MCIRVAWTGARTRRPEDAALALRRFALAWRQCSSDRGLWPGLNAAGRGDLSASGLGLIFPAHYFVSLPAYDRGLELRSWIAQSLLQLRGSLLASPPHPLAPLRARAGWWRPRLSSAADWLRRGRGGAVGNAGPLRFFGAFPPCRLWRAVAVRLRGVAVSAPQHLSLHLCILYSLRGTVGVKAKLRRKDATKWPAICEQSFPPGRRRSPEGAPSFSGWTGMGRPSYLINAMAFSPPLRAAGHRLGGGQSRSCLFSVRCCSPFSSLSSSPSPT